MTTAQMTDNPSFQPTPESHTDATDPNLLTDPNILHLDHIISDQTIPWQIHNCKIIDKLVTQDEKLPFIYHYDALTDELKAVRPLTPELLKQFQTPMYASEAAQLLTLDPKLTPTPWQAKVTGTLVMFCERLQLALRLKFTNTAKTLDPIYSKTQEQALKLALQNWHFYGEVFVLYKGNHPLVMTLDDDWLSIPSLDGYQLLPAQYSLATLVLLEQQKQHLPQLTETIEQRLL
ncbi:hypothetical protein [Psychrobacter lutiphocae]|uniref:hypothetical protein n=1 Tax=Psychrobacter lutiphocae TaxID=540500 RepID=UPI00037D33D6|nr:hypothetical protein [Psychrobacter lutiphocae]